MQLLQDGNHPPFSRGQYVSQLDDDHDGTASGIHSQMITDPGLDVNPAHRSNPIVSRHSIANIS